MEIRVKTEQILRDYINLQEILMDKDLAKLGDAYVNFVFSLATSQKLGRPIGTKVDNRTLAEAVNEADLRRVLPPRTDRHTRGNAAEALIVYAWIQGVLSLDDCLTILRRYDNPSEAFAKLLQEISEKLNLNFHSFK